MYTHIYIRLNKILSGHAHLLNTHAHVHAHMRSHRRKQCSGNVAEWDTRENIRTRKRERVLWNAILETWYGYQTHEHIAAVIIWRRPTWDQAVNGRGTLQSPPLIEELQAVGTDWGEKHSFYGCDHWYHGPLWPSMYVQEAMIRLSGYQNKHAYKQTWNKLGITYQESWRGSGIQMIIFHCTHVWNSQ